MLFRKSKKLIMYVIKNSVTYQTKFTSNKKKKEEKKGIKTKTHISRKEVEKSVRAEAAAIASRRCAHTDGVRRDANDRSWVVRGEALHSA